MADDSNTVSEHGRGLVERYGLHSERLAAGAGVVSDAEAAALIEAVRHARDDLLAYVAALEHRQGKRPGNPIALPAEHRETLARLVPLRVTVDDHDVYLHSPPRRYPDGTAESGDRYSPYGEFIDVSKERLSIEFGPPWDDEITGRADTRAVAEAIAAAVNVAMGASDAAD